MLTRTILATATRGLPQANKQQEHRRQISIVTTRANLFSGHLKIAMIKGHKLLNFPKSSIYISTSQSPTYETTIPLNGVGRL